MRKKVKVIKKLAAAGLAAILACQVMGCGTGEKPTKDVSDEKVSEVKSQDTKKEVLKVAVLPVLFQKQKERRQWKKCSEDLKNKITVK